METDNPPNLVTPASVKAIISKIETAQLMRTQEDVSTQLSDILDNVNCAINRFQEELGYDLKERAKPHQPEQKGKKRFILLEKIASFSKDAEAKEKRLYEILQWLGEWGDNLTYEINNSRSVEEDEALDEWIEVMEKVLPLSLMATKGGIESLISLCSTLIEDQKKRTQMSKHNFWQDWHKQSPQKNQWGFFPEPPSPEQMLQDKNVTHSNVSEVRSMLQELLDSTMFNRGEVKAIRYMSAVVENLNKALTLQHKENKSLESKYKFLEGEMNKELSTQRMHFEKSIQVLESKRDALLKQVTILGDKYHNLLAIKHVLELRLKMVQMAGGPEEPAEGFAGALELPEKETLPEVGTALEEEWQEPKEEGQVFSALSPSLLTKAWDGGTTPVAQKSLSDMDTDLRTKDVFIDRTEPLEPVLLHSDIPQIPTQWEKLVDQEAKDQGDHIQEEGDQSKSYPEKSLSPGSTRRTLLESHMGHWEEELIWETRRQQWLQEEEMWLQRQKKWTLMEQEHQEKVRQWEAEAAARQQWQRLTQPEEEKQSPRKEQKAGSEKMIFTTTSRWKNLEKSESATKAPHCRAQSAGQSRSYLLTPHGQQSGQRTQRTLCSAEIMQTPWIRQVSAKLKKSSSLPVTGTSIRRVTWASLQKAAETPKDKIYHIDMEGHLKNLQILGGAESELVLPQYQRSKALEVIAVAMDLSVLRLQYLCQKYIHYRRFQSLRQEVIKHIGALRQTRVTHRAQNLYVFLENIDSQQSLRLQAWTDKQKDLEERHQECLHTMMVMFPKLKQEWNVHLNLPALISVKPPVKSRSSPVLLQRVRSSHSATKQPPPPKHRESVSLRITGQQGNPMEAIWKADVASSSHPIEKKTPTNLSWEQLGGYPDIPRLLAVNEHPTYPRSSTSFKARASAVQRKECRESSEELTELVCQVSSQSLPGSIQSQKDRAASVPTPSLS